MSDSGPVTGIMGGSFDPVHYGHIAIAKSFLNSGLISELWLILTPQSPHKTDQRITDYNLRLKMLRQAFCDEQNIIISDIEHQLDPPYYTLHTVQHLIKHHPSRSFRLCIGEDSLTNLDTWHRWREILDYCSLLVASRPSSQTKNLAPGLNDKVQFIQHNPVEISSTEVREKCKMGESISKLVPTEVRTIIKNNNLYRG